MFEVKVLNAINRIYRKVAALCQKRIEDKSSRSVKTYQYHADFSETFRRIAIEHQKKASDVGKEAFTAYCQRQAELAKAGVVTDTALSHKL